MAVVEGHSEHVMDSLGEPVIPGLADLRAAMERRRESRSAPERVVERLLGLDLKLAQYRVGKAFCDARRGARRHRGPERRLAGPRGAPGPARAGRSGRLAARRVAAPGRRLSGASFPNCSCNRSGGSGLQTCVRWYSSTELRTNKLPERPGCGVGESQKWLPRHKHSARRPPRRPPPPAAATPPSAASPLARPPRRRAQAELSAAAVVQAQAERAVLIPVGAALVARDAVRRRRQALHRGSRERREGAHQAPEARLARTSGSSSVVARTARNRAVREVKRTRTRLERELRQRRTKAVRTVKGVRADAERQVKIHPPRGRASGRGPRAARGRDRLSNAHFPPAGWRDRHRGEAAGNTRQCSISPPSVDDAPRGVVGLCGASGARFASATIEGHALREPDPRLPPPGHRPRAAQGHRRRSGWSARSSSPSQGRVDVVVSLTTARLPDPRALREGRGGERRRRSTAWTTVTVAFDVLSDDEKQGLQQRLGRQGGLPRGRARRRSRT